jgi:hypothetical protein
MRHAAAIAELLSLGGITRMKSCSYCGRENEAAALDCRECGTSFRPEVRPSGSMLDLEVALSTSACDARKRLGKIGARDGILQRRLRSHRLIWTGCFFVVAVCTARIELLPDLLVWQSYLLIPLGCVQIFLGPAAGLLQLGIGIGVLAVQLLVAWLLHWGVALFLPRHENAA